MGCEVSTKGFASLGIPSIPMLFLWIGIEADAENLEINIFILNLSKFFTPWKKFLSSDFMLGGKKFQGVKFFSVWKNNSYLGVKSTSFGWGGISESEKAFVSKYKNV